MEPDDAARVSEAYPTDAWIRQRRAETGIPALYYALGELLLHRALQPQRDAAEKVANLFDRRMIQRGSPPDVDRSAEYVWSGADWAALMVAERDYRAALASYAAARDANRQAGAEALRTCGEPALPGVDETARCGHALPCPTHSAPAPSPADAGPSAANRHIGLTAEQISDDVVDAWLKNPLDTASARDVSRRAVMAASEAAWAAFERERDAKHAAEAECARLRGDLARLAGEREGDDLREQLLRYVKAVGRSQNEWALTAEQSRDAPAGLYALGRAESAALVRRFLRQMLGMPDAGVALAADALSARSSPGAEGRGK